MAPKTTLNLLLSSMLLFGTASAVTWKSAELTKETLPSKAIENRDEVDIESKSVEVEGTKVQYLEALPPFSSSFSSPTLFLLHGAAYSSADWRRIKTLQTIAATGHRVIAVNLPRGRLQVSRGSFLASLIRALAQKKVVLVSPSYSGSFALPLLTSPQAPELLAGYVPVAPGDATSFKTEFADVSVPTMIVVGENDGRGSSEALSLIPTSTQLQVIPDAGHAAYLDQPEIWHKLLYNFMKLLGKKQE